jgi:DNA-directed RNA polymerase sigma subunit (sigma70/sigma32)
MPYGNSDPKEIQAGRFKWLDRYIYQGIGSIQADLNPTERALLVEQLATALKRYETMTLSMLAVRRELYRQYTEAIIEGRSISQFSRNFSMSVKGLNKQIGEQVVNAFKAAFEHERIGNTFEAAITLQLAGLNHRLLFSPVIEQIVRANNSAAARELIRINQYREKLYMSVVKMVTGIARRHGEYLDGNIIEWSDLVQEANIATIHAIEAYHPVADGKTFTSYIHTYVNGIVSKRVNEATRTVVIPRTTTDRFACVQTAMDALGIVESDIMGGTWANGKMMEGKLSDELLETIVAQSNKFRSRNKPKYTAQEVEALLILSGNEISLDKEIGDPSTAGSSMTLGDTIEDDTIGLEERLDGKYLYSRLMSIVQRFSNEEEYALMRIRYGGDYVRGYKPVAEQYVNETGLPMNKGKVAEIEQTIFKKIRDAIESDEEMKRSFEELAVSLNFLGNN